MIKEVVKINSLRITFEGKLLPDYVAVGNLLIPVRMYTRKAMFCEKCNRYKGLPNRQIKLGPFR
jgi:hypothetical protein